MWTTLLLKSLALGHEMRYSVSMDTINLDAGNLDDGNLDAGRPASQETESEPLNRLAWEADGIARARASIAAGYYATSAEVNAWIDSLGTANPLPVPHPRQPRSR